MIHIIIWVVMFLIWYLYRTPRELVLTELEKCKKENIVEII